MTAVFRVADNQFGGSHSRTAIANYFNEVVEPKLATAGPGLFAAAAEVQQVAGWMTCETCPSETMGR